MTNLVDIVVDADGTPAQGQVTVYWPMFLANGTPVTQGQRAYEIVDGNLNVNLYPTTNAQPSGSYYTATFQLDNGSIYDEYWVVPALNTVKLNQIRAMFPPAPGLFVNANQLTGGGATTGQFLGWNGSQWVPQNPSLANFTPNNFIFALGASADTDLSLAVTGGDTGLTVSIPLGGQITLNVPDASPAARGVVNTGSQTFGGAKTFQDQASFQGALVVQSFIPANPQWGTIWFDAAQNTLHLQGSLVAHSGTLTMDQIGAGHLHLQGQMSESVTIPQGVTFPGKEMILFSGVSVAHGIGVDVNDRLWLGSGRAFAFLRPDAAWTASWIDLSPYQHPTLQDAEAQPSQASIVLYKDATQWIGMGVDNAMRIWFRIGLNGAGTYYYLHPDGGSLGVSTWINSAFVGKREGINLVAGRFVTMTAIDNPGFNTVDVTINAAGNLVDPTLVRGDMLVRGTSTVDRLPAVYDGTYRVLVSNATAPLGVAWTVGVPTSRRIVAGAGLWGGGDLSDDINIGANVISVFGRTGVIQMNTADIINAGGMVDPMLQRGDLIVRGPYSTVNNGTTRLSPGIAGSVLVCDPAQPLGVYWVPGAEFGAQTPWLQDIDGAGYNLTNVGNLQVNSGTLLDGTLAVGGDSALTGNLAVGGTSVLTGDLAVGGDSVLTGTLDVGGDFSVGGASTLTGDVGLGADLSVAGNTGLDGNLDVAGGGTVAGDFGVGGDTTLAGALAVTGDSALTGTLDVTGDSAFGNIAVTGTSDFTGDITVTGDVAFTGDFGVTGNSALTGDLDVDGIFSVTGTSTLTGDITTGGDLEVGGDLKVIGDFFTGGTLINGDLTATGDSDLQGDLNVGGDTVIGGSLKVSSITTGSTTPVAFTPPLEAGSIDLNPDIQTWGNVQAAITAIQSSIETLQRGMSYVGSYDAANDIATFVPALSALDGSLPPADAAGLQQGDFLIATSDSATVNTGDQLLSGGPTGGPNWDILPVGHVSMTASMVALSPQIGTWTTVQDALGHISDGDLQTPWLRNISADGYALCSGATTNSLVFATGTTTAPTERMRIASSGNVGIGRTAPAASLDVAGNVMLSSVLYTPAGTDLQLGAGSVTERVRVTTAGNVGIGNAAPLARLTVQGAGTAGAPTNANMAAAVLISDSNLTTNSGGELRLGFRDSYFCAIKGLGIDSTANTLGHMAFYTRSTLGDASLTERMRIESGGPGNIGIGTQSPGALLHVNGNMIVNNTITSPANLTLAAGSQSFALYIQASNGNVGVGGTASPAAKLTVTGVGSVGPPVDANASAALLVTSASGTANQGGEIRIGFGTGLTYFYALKGLGSDGSNNTAGHLAFYSRIASANTSVTEVMRLNSAGVLGIGNDGALPQSSGLRFLIVGSTTVATNYGVVAMAGNTANTDAAVGDLSFCNYNITATDKRLAVITGRTSGAVNSGVLVFYTANAGSLTQERMRITPSGDVGIGSSLPGAVLDVYRAGGDSTIRVTADQTEVRRCYIDFLKMGITEFWLGLGGPTGSNLYVYNRTNSRDLMYLEPGGNVEVPNGSITCGPKTIAGNGYVRIRAGTASNSEAYVSFVKQTPAASAQEYQIGLVDASGNFILWGSNTANPSTIHWTATPAGRFGIGGIVPTYQLQLSTDSAAKPGTNTWLIVSDLRTKRNVQPFDGGIETIRQLEPIVAEYNGMAHMPDGQRVVSLDPAKLKEIVPHAVSGVHGKLRESDVEETEILGVNTHEIFYHLLRAVQQVDRRLQRLEEKIGQAA